MAAVVDSPLVLTSLLEHVTSGGRFVAGRRRRINNDPYGGDGYVWEDWVAPSDVERNEIPEAVERVGDDAQIPICSTKAEVPPEEHSVAVQRLDQLKQHLVTLSTPQTLSTDTRPAGEGMSMDTIHLNIGDLQDWQSPLRHHIQQPGIASSCVHLDKEWQRYAHRKLFGIQGHPDPIFQESGNSYSVFDKGDNSLGHRLNHQYHTGQLQTRTQRRSATVSLESMDVHCNSWSSLMAHQRREIAAVA